MMLLLRCSLALNFFVRYSFTSSHSSVGFGALHCWCLYLAYRPENMFWQRVFCTWVKHNRVRSCYNNEIKVNEQKVRRTNGKTGKNGEHRFKRNHRDIAANETNKLATIIIKWDEHNKKEYQSANLHVCQCAFVEPGRFANVRDHVALVFALCAATICGAQHAFGKCISQDHTWCDAVVVAIAFVTIRRSVIRSMSKTTKTQLPKILWPNSIHYTFLGFSAVRQTQRPERHIYRRKWTVLQIWKHFSEHILHMNRD